MLRAEYDAVFWKNCQTQSRQSAETKKETARVKAQKT